MSQTGPRLRAVLDGIPTYKPGRPAPVRDGMPAYKISSNENPYPPLPSVQTVIADAGSQANRYPDMFATGLVARLAQRFGVPESHVATGTGSVGVCQQVVQSMAGDGDEIIYAWRSFEAYPIIAATTGAQSIKVPNTATHEHNLKAMAGAVSPGTRLIFVCNPNNPTGTSIGRAGLDEFLAGVPEDVIVVLDEAYREFVTDPEVRDGLEAYGDRPNVVVLRTLSKAWGLAGLRIGYLVAQPAVAGAVRKVVTPFSTSAAAQAAAIAALDQEAEMRRRCDIIIAERERVHATLAKWLPEVPRSQANFVWLPLRERAVEFAQACEAHKVIVRPFAGDGVRVTIGTPDENDAFLAAAEKYLGPEADLSHGK